MGKVLKILGVVFLVLVVAIVALLVWAHGKGEKEMTTFFQAVETGQPEKVRALMAPELAKEFDPPIFKMWLDAFNERMGSFSGLAKSNFNTKTQATGNGTVTVIEGTAMFEKGEAEVSMQYTDGKMTFLKINSDAMEKNWFSKPDEEFYKARAKEFIEDLTALRAEAAMAMMYPALYEQVSQEQLVEGMTKFREKYGQLKTITFDDVLFKSGSNDGAMRLLMKCECEKQTVPAYVDFQFLGMRGQIVAFLIPGTPDDM
jgi:hypothetical protein